MHELPADNSLGNIEALINSAGDYLDVSPDVRPELLESARQQARDQRRSRWLGLVVVAMLLVSLLAINPAPRSPSAQLSDLTTSELAQLDPLRIKNTADLFLLANAMPQAEPSWKMVHAFCKVQRRRSDLFRDAL